ncbi:MAG TPA: hypothetical protein VHD58_11270 [Mycobacteriales bacterium]|nr:hypothetical protein [Mycobacteriales bacterium]
MSREVRIGVVALVVMLGIGAALYQAVPGSTADHATITQPLVTPDPPPLLTLPTHETPFRPALKDVPTTAHPARHDHGSPDETTTVEPVPTAAGTGFTDAVGDLTVTPVGSGTCEGTYRPGEQLHLAGSGFGPGAAVRVYFVGPAESAVGTFTADAAGSFRGAVRIPASATGFVPQGGLAFLNALGLGPNGEHVDDNAMFDVAQLGSACA